MRTINPLVTNGLRRTHHSGHAPVGRTRRHRRTLGRLIVVALAALLLPVVALAHPLGNFSVNRYAKLDVGRTHVDVLYIVDMAEIPTLQARNGAGLEADPTTQPAAEAAYATTQATALAEQLRLEIDGRAVPLTLTSSTIDFPVGQAGLLTQRLTLHLRAADDALDGRGDLVFTDNNFPGRLGWQEVIVRAGPEMQLVTSDVPAEDVSNELRAYPADPMQAQPATHQATVTFAPQGATLDDAATAVRPMTAAAAPVENGFARLIEAPVAGPFGMLLALLAAFGWGAAHALSPGHGKTIVGAYLVGARGTARHALFLGLTTTITHTAGVFALGLVTLFAARFILPETLFPWLSLISGLAVVAIGLVMAERWWRGLRQDRHHSHDHVHPHEHAHDHPHGHEHDHEHGHTHSHMPPGADGGPITWRSLLALGISGGLLPCPSALVEMLSAIALQRVGLGLVLIIAFSLGLAGVLTGVGMAMVYAGKFVARLPSGGRAVKLLPIASALFITLAGLGITWQALGGMR
ncbi:MAG: hypothetical protein KDE20_06435 [Caldilineaceae bacterium]|nr:hypothetical protein [Caldilineaceae bacterium]